MINIITICVLSILQYIASSWYRAHNIDVIKTERERELGTNNNNNNRKEKDVIIIIMRGTVCLSVTASLSAAAPPPPEGVCPKGRLSVFVRRRWSRASLTCVILEERT